ncbi:MAG TPA: tyrosine-type recombinase/integrase [bacterium]|jgi:integrase|nr:tyrosine-type recombinase/integrase [bacterium]
MAYLWRRSKPVTDSRGKPIFDETGRPKTEQVGKWLIVDKFKVQGKWRNQTFPTGTEDFLTAQKELGKHELRVGNRVGGVRDTPFNVFLKDMRTFQGKATLSYDRKEKYTYSMLEKEFGTRLLGEFTPVFIEDWQESLFERGLAQSTIHKYMGSLRHILNIGIKRDAFRGPNPFVKVDICKPGKPRELILSPEEQVKLLKACLIPQNDAHAIDPKTLHDIVFVALRLGMRKGEIIGVPRYSGGIGKKVGGLRVRDYDPKTKVLKFYRSKTDSMTEIDLSGFPDMAEVFARRAKGKTDPNEFLFTRRGKPIFDVCKAYRLAITKAKIEKIDKRTGKVINFTFHDLRHTACVDQLRAGVPLEVVARVLGDDIRTIHKVYARELQQGHMAAGMKLFAQYLRK